MCSDAEEKFQNNPALQSPSDEQKPRVFNKQIRKLLLMHVREHSSGDAADQGRVLIRLSRNVSAFSVGDEGANGRTPVGHDDGVRLCQEPRAMCVSSSGCLQTHVVFSTHFCLLLPIDWLWSVVP